MPTQAQSSAKPRVVHLIHRDDVGGGATAIKQHLRHYGNRFETWVLHGSRGPLAEVCESWGLRHVQVPIETKLKCLWGIFVLWFRLRQIKPDLMIVHGQWAGPVGSVVGKLAGVRRILYIAHWPSFYSDWDCFRVLRNFFAEKIPLALCDHVVTLSDSNRYQYLIRFLQMEDKFVTLSNALDLSVIPGEAEAEAIRREYQWSGDEVQVVSVGRLESQKRIDWLLDSWKIVQESGVKAHLWIIGTGEEEVAMRWLAGKLGIVGSCTFLGSRPNGIHFIRAADIVAMTSLFEGHAMIPLEAMACGRAVVANSADGVRDSFADGVEGFLVTPSDVALFAQRLLTLIHDPGRREAMGEAGRKRVKVYNLARVMNQYVKLIEFELSRKD